MNEAIPAKRGRPSKFGRPGQVVAVTLPDEVVRGLRRTNPDLGWAIVTLFEGSPASPSGRTKPDPDAELVRISGRRSLIVVNRAVFKNLPGVNIIPLHGNRAFLALEIGKGMSDLELAVIDRLGESHDPDERKALRDLRSQLKKWRHDRELRFHMRAIILVERVSGARTEPPAKQ